MKRLIVGVLSIVSCMAVTSGQVLEIVNDIVVDGYDMNLSQEKSVEIVGEDTDDMGILSAYMSHKFTVVNNTGLNLTDIKWQLTLPLKDGNSESISQSDGTTEFYTPQLSDGSQYEVSSDGVITGKIIFMANAGSENVSDSYQIELDMKPRINEVTIDRKESNAPYDNYNLYYTVDYVGASKLLIYLQEQYGGTLVSQTVNEASPAHVVTKNINSPFSAKIHINVENNYGSDMMTLRLPPYTGDDVTAVEDVMTTGYTDIVVYDLSGTVVANVTDTDGLQRLYRGVYILAYYDNGRFVSISKYLKR